MSGYHVDWVGAISAGIAAAIAFFLIKTAFPRLTGVSLYLVLGTSIAALSLVLREILRHIGV
jgi:hypothetical protein